MYFVFRDILYYTNLQLLIILLLFIIVSSILIIDNISFSIEINFLFILLLIKNRKLTI